MPHCVFDIETAPLPEAEIPPALIERLRDADPEVVAVEVVVAHAQAVTRLAGVDGVGAVREGVTHVLDGARGA